VCCACLEVNSWRPDRSVTILTEQPCYYLVLRCFNESSVNEINFNVGTTRFICSQKLDRNRY